MENEAQVHIHTRRTDREIAEDNHGQTILTSISRYHLNSRQDWRGRSRHVSLRDFEAEIQNEHQALKFPGFVTDCIIMKI